MAKLTASRVKSIRDKGRYGDGGGLYLVVRPSGTKAWVMRAVVDGRRRDIGLGGYPAVSLAQARNRLADGRVAIANGRDPVGDKRKRATPTFREAALAVLELNKPRWKSAKHGANWIQMLERHAMPTLGSVPIDRIGRADVLEVLTPIWTTRQETARRVRQRLKAIFRWAMSHGYIEQNPAGEAIDGALPPMPQVREHFRSLQYREVGKALDIIERSTASKSAKLCLQFTILTAVRSGESRAATWDDLDMGTRTWTIPAEKMKAGRPHRVPVSHQARDVLTQARLLQDESNLVFPSPLRPGRMLSDMTLTKILRDNGLADRATVHGFRSSFKDWTMEQTDTPWAVGEAALAHTLGNSTEQAYARSDLFERRRDLMQQWADYLTG